MIIFDKISYEAQKNLREKLTNAGIECAKIEDFSKDKRIDNAICVFTLEKHFFTTEAFEFLRDQVTFTSVGVILVVKRTSTDHLESGNIAKSYIDALIGPKRKDCNNVTEIEDVDEDYMFEVINAQINPSSDEKKNKVTIYTDGACSGNPGAGGWASILIGGGKTKEISGGEANTTNNRMEMLAVIKALETLKKPCEVEVYSDSAYLVNAFELGWLKQWKNNCWKNSDQVLVKNIDLWQKLDSLTSIHQVHFNKVKGHADNKYNNRCDELAVIETKKLNDNI